MSASESRGSGQRPLEDDQVFLILLGLGALVALPTLLGRYLARWWTQLLDWLIGHHIVIPGSSHPLLKLPDSDGAGLDAARVVAAVVVILVAGFVGFDHGRRLSRRRRQQGGSR